MKARRTLVLAAAVAAVLAATTASGGAQSGPAKAGGKKCASGALCVWTKKNYRGTKYKVTEPGNLVKLPKAANDKVSSAKNRWVNRAYLYETKGGGGQFFCLDPGQNIANFADFPDEFNDDASSAFLAEDAIDCGP
jgi:hypothetical protein